MIETIEWTTDSFGAFVAYVHGFTITIDKQDSLYYWWVHDDNNIKVASGVTRYKTDAQFDALKEIEKQINNNH